MNRYWNERFLKEGKIWGDSPSSTAALALSRFQGNGVKSVLVPGSGYGRNTRLFSRAGLRVTGIEVSAVAYEMAREFDALSQFINASFLDIEPGHERFDAVYCFNVLHLFKHTERRSFMEKCLSHLKVAGLLYFTVFSELEESVGRGTSPEPGTFESKPGRPVHYFTGPDLHDHFEGCDLLESGLASDEENHGEGPHTHVLRYIYARKAGGR